MREVYNEIEEYKYQIEQLELKVGNLNEEIDMVMEEKTKTTSMYKKYCIDFDYLVSKHEDLNTKRTYKIRPSTASKLKQIKKGLYATNSDITMNELADAAIQIYYQLIINRFKEIKG